MTEPELDADSGGKPLDEAIQEWIAKKAKPDGDGNYAREAGRVMDSFQSWAIQRNVQTVPDITVRTMMRYAEFLTQRAEAREADPADEDGITGRTAQQYYAYVRAFLTYARKWGYIDENPAGHGRAEDELPPASLGSSGTTQQFWSPRERTQLLRFVDKRAHDAIDQQGSNAVVEVRDRALVYLLAYSGARSAEVLRDPNDSRRSGIRWRDIDLDNGTVAVLGKNQSENEEVQLPEQAHTPLIRLRQVLDPPTNSWPVFPSFHNPSRYQKARQELSDVVHELEDELDEGSATAVLRRYEVPPPSLTTEACRRLFKQLTEAADIEVEDGYSYLKPHGARRGVGEVLYRTKGPAAAQRVLRHADPSTTSEMYSHLEAGDQAEIATEAFEEVDE